MTPSNDPWTIGRLLTWTADYLGQHGSESPRLDAEVLLAHARGCERIELYTCFELVAPQPLLDGFRALVKKRAAGMPVAYLVGHREFYSRDFAVTPDVLIPRPETEFVVVALVDLIKQHAQDDQPVRIVDVGTGSGILAVCAAALLPQAELTALDVSPAALTVASGNAAAHQVGERICFVQSDLFAALDPEKAFDYIVSNPPYIGLSEKDQLARDIVDHEPHVALFAGEKGLDVLRQLIVASVERLNLNGWLITEFSPHQQAELIDQLAQIPQYGTPKFVDDISNRPRVLTVQRVA